MFIKRTTERFPVTYKYYKAILRDDIQQVTKQTVNNIIITIRYKVHYNMEF